MTLNGIRLFQGLSNLELAKILGRMDKRQTPAGSVLFRQGDDGDSMFIIRDGSIRLFAESDSGSGEPLALLGDGDTLGEMALLTGEPRSATAIAASDSTLYVLDKEAFERLIEEHPRVSSYFISLLSQRLVRTNGKLQASNETKARWIAQELGQMPEAWRRFFIDCALFPRVDKSVCEELFGRGLMATLRTEFDKLNEFVRFDPEDGDWFALAPDVKPVLRELLLAERPESWLDELRRKAARVWVEGGEWEAAIRLYAEEGKWEDALGLADRAPQGAGGFGWLDRCPPELLASHYEALTGYLRDCAARSRESGYAKLDAILETGKHGFGAERLVSLYEIGAEVCRSLGLNQQSLAYLSMAEAFAETAAGTMHSSSLTGDRAYRLAKEKFERQKATDLAAKAGSLLRGSKWSTIAGICAALLSLGYFHFASPIGGLSVQGMDFVGIGIAAVALWIVNLVPDYLVALFMAMGWVLEGLVEPEVALSGFATPTWLYMLFILALGAAITKSGILYRLSLHALKRFPPSYRGQLWGIVAGGAALNPLIPSSSAKVALGVPIARTLAESMGFKDRSGGAAGLGLAATVFYGFTAPFVLTGSYSNVMAFGLVQGAKQPNWFEWFLYALPAFIVFSAIVLVFLFLAFRKPSTVKPIFAQALDEQLGLLGKLSKGERATAGTVVGCIALMILQPLHGIDNAWIMLLGFAWLVVTGTLDSQTLKTGIDWPFLLFIGIAFSFAEAAKQLGIAQALSSFVGEHMSPFMGSPALFLAAVMLLSFLVTFIVRDDPALILLVVALIPLADQAGVHPWVLVFVILLSTDPFFFAYQSPTYLMAYYSAEGKSFSHRQGQRIAVGYAIAAMAAVLASVPYWRWLGLISG